MQEVDWKGLCRKQQDTIDAMNTAYKTLLETYKMVSVPRYYISGETYTPSNDEREKCYLAEIKRLEANRDAALLYVANLNPSRKVSPDEVFEGLMDILGEP